MLIFFPFFQLPFFPLSLLKSAEFTEMCPKGKGFVPVGEYSYDVGGENYKGENRVLMNFQDMCPIRHSSKSMACVRQN